MKTNAMPVISVRVPQPLKAALMVEAARLRLRPADLIRHTLAERLVDVPQNQKPPLETKANEQQRS
jgi:hypothetical protein